MNKFLTFLFIGVLAVGLAVLGFLYTAEVNKNSLLNSETQKTAEDSRRAVERLQAEIKDEKEKAAEDKKKLADLMTKIAEEKERAVKEAERIKKTAQEERQLSLVASDDLESLRREVAVLRKESREAISKLDASYKKKKKMYDTRILSLEAELAKSKGRFSSEAERYHYNLGVLYAQNKDYDIAVAEFKASLGFNPKNASACYNLGVIFDDYFKDKENAKFYYRSFLDLCPTCDEAESVKEWLKDLEK